MFYHLCSFVSSRPWDYLFWTWTSGHNKEEIGAVEWKGSGLQDYSHTHTSWPWPWKKVILKGDTFLPWSGKLSFCMDIKLGGVFCPFARLSDTWRLVRSRCLRNDHWKIVTHIFSNHNACRFFLSGIASSPIDIYGRAFLYTHPILTWIVLSKDLFPGPFGTSYFQPYFLVWSHFVPPSQLGSMGWVTW